MLNNLLQFVSAAMQTPRIALAVINDAIQTPLARMLCGGTVLVGFVGFLVFKRLRQQRTTPKDWQEQRDELIPEPTQNGLQEKYTTMDEDAFRAWWQSGMDAKADAFVTITEYQARWWYAAYLNNEDIVLAQTTSNEVVE